MTDELQVRYTVNCPQCHKEDPSEVLLPCIARMAAGDKSPCNCGEKCRLGCDGSLYRLPVTSVPHLKRVASDTAQLTAERDQLRQQVAELAQALRETVALLRPESRGGLSDSRARAILAKHAKVSA